MSVRKYSHYYAIIILWKKAHKNYFNLTVFLSFFMYDILNDTSVMLLYTKMFLAGPYK